jgi:hypothetical protein
MYNFGGSGNVSTELQSLTGFFHPLLMDYASIPNRIPGKIRHLEQFIWAGFLYK